MTTYNDYRQRIFDVAAKELFYMLPDWNICTIYIVKLSRSKIEAKIEGDASPCESATAR